MSWLCTLQGGAQSTACGSECHRRATDRYEVSCNLSKKGVSESQTVERDAFREDLRSLLRQHLVALPPSQQEVIRLAFFEEKSQREISALTQTPLGTVKTRIELGIKKLSHTLGGLREKVV
jgi:RNA polymerase sigma-70 factor (ECF subfamily)